jgi:YVTN family beta-propeller protein
VRVAFSGSNLLVTNAAAGTVSVIDTNSRIVTRTISVGFGPYGIAATGALAVVTNMQGGSLSLINLADYSVSSVDLPPGTRPHEVAISTAAGRAVVTAPMSNGFYLLNLNTRELAFVETGLWNAMGPGAVATHNNLAFVANHMTASVTVADVSAGRVLTSFPVDPGPRALAVNPAKNQLLVLSQGTGTLQVVSLNGYTITARLNAGVGDRRGHWNLPQIASLNPASGRAGSAPFTLTITGSNLQGVTDVEFRFANWQGGGPDGGMTGGGGMGGGMHGDRDGDPNIKVSNVQVNSDGTQITCMVEILAVAAEGYRQVRLDTEFGDVMGPMMGGALFNVTK